MMVGSWTHVSKGDGAVDIRGVAEKARRRGSRVDEDHAETGEPA